MTEPWYRPWSELIARYFLETEGRVVTVEEIEQQPMYKIWGWYMDALAHYKLEKRYFSLDDVPERLKVDGQLVFIREPGKVTEYIWRADGWKKVGTIYDEFYKG